MKPILSLTIIVSMMLALSGCIIRTQSRGRSRACPPAHHWDGYACVHNGRGRPRDHRRR